MAHYEKHYWLSDGSGVTRRQRQSCEYESYVPDRLAGRRFVFDGDVAADVMDAETAIVKFNASAATLVSTEALARLLLRAESVASSRIEGLVVGARRLLRVEAIRESAQRTSDVTAEEVLGNIDAMQTALAAAGDDRSVSVDTLMQVHERLLRDTQLSRHAGMLREEQNWIGGNRFNPCGAAFVPPPHEMVAPLLEDLCEFCNDDTLPAVAQAAIAHAQFETIHPFVDGNGRAGRALIHTILRRRGIAPRIVPPVSLILATLATDYVAALTGYRYEGDPGSVEARDGINQWVALFAGCCSRAVDDAHRFEEQVHDIQAEWRARLGVVRSNSTLDLALDRIAGAPVLTVSGLAEMTGRSFEAANGAMERLVSAGVLTVADARRRNRVYEAREIIDAFTGLERQLASEQGDTIVSPPSRKVPQRPR